MVSFSGIPKPVVFRCVSCATTCWDNRSLISGLTPASGLACRTGGTVVSRELDELRPVGSEQSDTTRPA